MVDNEKILNGLFFPVSKSPALVKINSSYKRVPDKTVLINDSTNTPISIETIL
jgi:hypothetical protein